VAPTAARIPLALPRRGARQEQVRGARAAEDQEERRRRHQDARRGEEVGAPLLGVEIGGAEQEEAPLAVGQRSRGFEAAGDGIERALRLRPPDAGSEAAEEQEPPLLAPFEARDRGHPVGLGERQIDRRGEGGTLEARRRHADDRERLAIELHRPADDPGVAPQDPLPEEMADHGDRGRAGAVVARLEQPAERRPRREEPEVTAADELPPGVGRLLAVAHRGAERRVDLEVDHGALAAGEVAVLRIGGERPRLLGGAGVHPHHALGVGRLDVRPGDRRDVGEEGGVRPDPQGEGEDDGDGHHRLAGERPQGDGEGAGRVAHAWP